MKKFFGEFKKFALRGNVLDLAVGVIVGAAFQAIVSALTDSILNPFIGALLGGQSIADFAPVLFGVPVGIGAFIMAIINFIITAFVLFLIVKGINGFSDKGKRKKDEPAATTKPCPFCFSEIDIRATRCPNCTTELVATKQDIV